MRSLRSTRPVPICSFCSTFRSPFFSIRSSALFLRALFRALVYVTLFLACWTCHTGSVAASAQNRPPDGSIPPINVCMITCCKFNYRFYSVLEFWSTHKIGAFILTSIFSFAGAFTSINLLIFSYTGMSFFTRLCWQTLGIFHCLNFR